MSQTPARTASRVTACGLSRRKFLGVSALAAGGTLAALQGVGCASKSPVKAATTDPPPRAYRVALTDAPALARTGGVHRVQTDGFNFSIVRRSATEFIALSNTCTHQACVVQHIEGEFVCPCHRSHFDLEGTPTRGPATAPLERYRVQFSDGVVEVALAP